MSCFDSWIGTLQFKDKASCLFSFFHANVLLISDTFTFKTFSSFSFYKLVSHLRVLDVAEKICALNKLLVKATLIFLFS